MEFRRPEGLDLLPRGFVAGVLAVSALPAVLGAAGLDLGLSGDAGGSGAGPLAHVALDWTATCIALLIAAGAGAHYAIGRDPAILVVSLSLGLAGMVDGLHALVGHGILHESLDAPGFLPYTWFIARTLKAVLILGGAWWLASARQEARGRVARGVFILALVLAAAAYGAMALGARGTFPPGFLVPGSVLPRPWDLAPLLLFVLAGAFALPRLLKTCPSSTAAVLLLSMVPEAASQAHMAFGSAALFDHHFNAAHGLKVLAYALPMAGGMLDIARAYRLADRSAELADLNARLNREVDEKARAESRFRALLESVPDGCVVCDADGRIEIVNAQAGRMFGYAREELLGQPVEVLVPADVRPRHADLRNAYLAQPRSRLMAQCLQCQGECKDGSVFPAEISLSPVALPGGLRVIAAIRDVSERRRMEEERADLQKRLEQSQRLESLGLLTGGIAHDFNNMLGVVQGFTSLASGALPEDSPVQEDLGEIRMASERAAALVRQLLAFSRMDVARSEVLDLNPVVRDIEKLLRRTLGEHIAFETAVCAGSLCVCADKAKLEQVILNLAVNARDAMKNGGRFRLETALVVLDGARPELGLPPGAYARLAAVDTGRGMPPEVAARVFDPFFTTKPRGQGTGLGLSTVHGIVVQAGGRVTLKTAPGSGSSFEVWLPAADPALVGDDSGCAKRTAEEAKGRGETVLLAEDSEPNRRLMERILADAGYRVLSACDGAEALRVAGADFGPIDLLLSDVIMPGMSGKELADRLLEIRPGLAVVYMSGYTDNLIAHHGVLESGVRLLQKPFDRMALLRELRVALDARAA